MPSDRPLRKNERALVEILTSVDSRYENLVIVVEGIRDERVLRKLGVKGRIIKTQAGRARPELIDEIAEQAGKNGEVLVLTDFDQGGIELAKFITKDLEPHKVKVLVRLRRRIRNLMGNLRAIEELVALFGRKDSPEPLETD
ncbi:MAG: toprim domain-containing protein [Candidatus Thorarchaeota archaeon]|nr:MAG: toprim domain-containing protein [Candidatus Thorarchaeota archaeon]